MPAVNNFTVIESFYGRFIVNRHSTTQAEYLIKTGKPHLEAELQIILKLIGTLAQDCVVVDAGCNIGLIGIPVAQAIREKGGTVHAFEVQRMLFYALCGAIALNDLQNIHANNKGVGASRRVVKIPRPDYGVPQDFGMFSLMNGDGLPGEEEVEIIAIDDLDLPRLDFLKIDVEGMEIDVLKGARQMISKCLPWIWVEYWKVGKETIKGQFEGLGYKFFRMDELNMLCAPIARIEDCRMHIAAEEF